MSNSSPSLSGHDTSHQFPRRNWVMVILVQVIVASSSSFILPSMYQFITASKSPPEDTPNSTHYWPGLGEPHIFYSLAVSALPVGVIVASFAAACLSHPFPYFYKILFASAVGGVGGLLYALAINGWMVIASRFISGVSVGLGVVFTQSYIGRTVGNGPRKGRNKKELLFILYSITVNISYIVATGLSVLMSQFPSINPYRWGGWFILAIALLYSILFVIIYAETESIRMKFKQMSSLSTKCGRKKQKYTKVKRSSIKWCSTFCVLVIYVYIHGMTLSLVDFINPILSDQFGLGVESISYFMLGVMIVWTSSSITLIMMAICKIESRIGLVSVMLLALVGSLLLSDWHGYGGNPCSTHSMQQSIVTAGDMFNDSSARNSSEEVELNGSDFFTSSGERGSGRATDTERLWVDNVNNIDAADTDSNSSFSLEVLVNSNISTFELCEYLSTSKDECFWNPKSRVTGEHCTTCRPVCLSTQKSLNFIQFTISIFIIIIILQPGLVFYSVVASNITKKKHQETVMGFLYAVGGFSRTLTPLWAIASYEKSAHHTYIPMSLLAIAYAVITVLVLLFYNWMAPRTSQPPSLILAAFFPEEKHHTPTSEEELSSAKLFRDSIHRWLDASNSSTSFQGSKVEEEDTDIIQEPVQQEPSVVTFQVSDT